MKLSPYSILLLGFLFSCSSKEKSAVVINEYSHNVGDILFDPNSDNNSFLLCDSTKIISGRSILTYSGGIKIVSDLLLENFRFQPEYESFSGYVVVRFIMNCKKETGRFRAQSLGFDFSLKECPTALKSHLISIVKELKNWEYKSSRGKDSDCSKFINFKIEHGKIENILQ